MSANMHIYAYIYIYVYTCGCVYMYLYVYISMCIFTYVHTDMYLHPPTFFLSFCTLHLAHSCSHFKLTNMHKHKHFLMHEPNAHRHANSQPVSLNQNRILPCHTPYTRIHIRT